MEQKTGSKHSSGFMDKEIGDRTIKGYMGIIKMPLMLLIGLSILSFLLGLLVYTPGVGGIFALLNIPLSLLIGLVSLVLACYIGYLAVKKYSGNLLTAAVAGGLAGVVLGLVSGVLSLLNAVISLAFGFGVFGGLLIAGALVALIISPITGAIVGAILSVIGGVVAGSSSFETPKAKATAPKT